jgi:quercetin dioxygenase-like cupin family protein
MAVVHIEYLPAALAVVVAFAYLAPSRAVSDSDTPKLSRKLIEQADIPGSDEELRLFTVEIAPGYSVPAHRHPVAGLCYMIEGAAETQYEGEAAKVVRAGESFQDEAGTTHSVFRNVSPTDRLKFLCATKIKKGQEYLLPK